VAVQKHQAIPVATQVIREACSFKIQKAQHDEKNVVRTRLSVSIYVPGTIILFSMLTIVICYRDMSYPRNSDEVNDGKRLLFDVCLMMNTRVFFLKKTL
jgi:hypothetical protein